MKPIIYVGYEAKQDVAYEVLAFSLRKHSSTDLDIRPLRLDHLATTIGFDRPRDPLQSTEFTYTRFLVPYLCHFQGRALFMDCDMLCLGDINDIYNLDLSTSWLRVVKQSQQVTRTTKMDGQAQTSYPRKNWSSLMLMNCASLTCWSLDAVRTQTGRWLHRFDPIPDAYLGEIPAEWNELDRYDDRTRMIHYTEGGPWLPECRDHQYGDIWFAAHAQWQDALALAAPAATRDQAYVDAPR